MIPSALSFASLIDSSDGSGGFFMFDLSTFHSAASAWGGRSIEEMVHVTFLPYPLTGHAWAQSGLRRRSGGGHAVLSGRHHPLHSGEQRVPERRAGAPREEEGGPPPFFSPLPLARGAGRGTPIV